MNENTKQLLLWGHENLKHLVIPMMKQYATRTPLPVVPVGGYPKSGTTWVSKMVAHYLDLPLIMASDPAFGFRYVVHHHWSYDESLDHSIQVVRDGRDVMVSLYMNLMKDYINIHNALTRIENHGMGKFLRQHIGLFARRKKLFHYLFGKDFDPWDVRKNLPAFMEYELQKPVLPAVREPWPVYVRRWLQGEKTVIVKYEDLLAGGPDTLGRVLSAYTGEMADEELVRLTHERYHFKRVTGRNPGEEDRRSFARKGVAGDWKNYFTAEACAVFQRYAGDLLVETGYEIDNSWVNT